LHCAAENPDADKHCSRCGARLPFNAPTEEHVEVQQPEPFYVPRRGELTSALMHSLESFRAGAVSRETFLERLRSALENVPAVFRGLIAKVEEASEDLPLYGDGVVIALEDCQVLFESGLREMLQYSVAGDDFHLRFGRLLVEKGEEEYLRVLDALQRDAHQGAFAGVDDLVGKLMEARRAGDCTEAVYQDELKQFQDHCDEVLEEAQSLIHAGLEAAGSETVNDETALKTSESLLQAADKLGGLVLNLYHPG
jgi:hypothetical protein